MDSTMVDYAINKLNEAFEKVAPTAVDLGEQYVGYVVLMLTVKTLFAFILGAIAILVGLLVIRRGLKINAPHPSSDDGMATFIGGTLLFIAGGFVFGVSAFYIPVIIVANTYPLMYAIEHLLK